MIEQIELHLQNSVKKVLLLKNKYVFFNVWPNIEKFVFKINWLKVHEIRLVNLSVKAEITSRKGVYCVSRLVVEGLTDSPSGCMAYFKLVSS